MNRVKNRLLALLSCLVITGAGLTAASSLRPTEAANTQATVTFAAAGDFGYSDNTKAVLSSIGAANTDLTLALGDLSYGVTGTTEQSWCDLVTSKVGLGYAFELVSGNHESNGLNGNINDFASCLPNQLPGVVGTYGRQYYVDYPRLNPTVRFVMISPGLTFPDSTWSYAAGTPRYNWTAAVIDDARAKKIPWVVTGMHFPCLNQGAYNCGMSADLFNLLVSKRVDLILNGHEHVYQRTKQLALSPACPAVVPGTYSADCVADGDDALVQGAGSVNLTVGTGGVSIRDINLTDSERDYFRATSALNANPSYGWMKFTANADTLTGSFVAATGSFTDSFTIEKPAPSPSVSPSVSPTVTISPTPTPTVRLKDTFERSVASGFGTSEIGGPWTVWTPTSNVSSGSGNIVMTGGGQGGMGFLSATPLADLDLSAAFTPGAKPTGNGLYLALTARRTSAGYLRAATRIDAAGTVSIYLSIINSTNTETRLTPVTAIPGVTYVPGRPLKLRLQLTGNSFAAKVWDTSEPTNWQAQTTITNPDYLNPGAAGFWIMNSSTSTGPMTVSLDDFVAVSTP